VKSPFHGVCRVVALLAASLFFAGAGCASDQQQLTLNSSRRGKAFIQSFSRAYAARDRDGDTNIVLVDRAAQTTLEGRPADAPVRQVLHIQVLWHPSREMKADHTSATNATLHWYVMSSTNPGDVLEYAGTAFVAIDQDSEGTDLTVSNAHLRPVACRGDLCDPVGPSSVSGKIRAANSAPRVRQALSIVRTAIAAQSEPVNTASSRNRPERPSSAAQ